MMRLEVVFLFQIMVLSSALRLQTQLMMDSVPPNKDIFMYWDHDEVPECTQLAAQSWKDKNPSWNFHMVHDSNLHTYINDTQILNILNHQTSPQFKSDVVRTNLLAIHGGVYADGDVFCSTPLDEWLASHMTSDFFAYRIEENKDKRICSSWFLAAAGSSYIANEMQKALNAKAALSQRPAHYYEWHYTFTELTKTDPQFKQLWDAAPQNFSLHANNFADRAGRRDECVIALRHLRKGTNMNSNDCVPLYGRDDCFTVKELIDGHCSPVYKMNRHSATTDADLFGIAKYVTSAQ